MKPKEPEPESEPLKIRVFNKIAALHSDLEDLKRKMPYYPFHVMGIGLRAKRIRVLTPHEIKELVDNSVKHGKNEISIELLFEQSSLKRWKRECRREYLKNEKKLLLAIHNITKLYEKLRDLPKGTPKRTEERWLRQLQDLIR